MFAGYREVTALSRAGYTALEMLEISYFASDLYIALRVLADSNNFRKISSTLIGEACVDTRDCF